MVQGRLNRAVVWSLVAVLVGTAPVAFPGEPGDPPVAARPDWLVALAEASPPGGGPGPAGRPAPVPWQESTSTPLVASRPAPAAEYAFPAPAQWEATLSPAATGALALDEPAGRPAGSGGERPVQVTAGGPGAAGRPVQIEVLDRAAAKRAGASGFLFTVAPAPGGPAGELPVELSIDYAGFADAYGAGYAGRLQVVALPGCVLHDPVPAGCDTTGVRLPARNDLAAGKLVVGVADLADPAAGAPVQGLAAGALQLTAGEVAESGIGSPAADRSVPSREPATVFAVTASPGGDGGTFAATPLSTSGTWQVSPGSGEFSYSYPIDAPEPGGGSPPAVALGYSSGAVDGLTVASNTQASPSGLGWSDFANAFIERSYEPCFRNVGTADLCWKSDNATISLAGVSGALIPVNAAHTEWRVQSDPGWRIERLTGAPFTNIHEQQYWKVTGPDGTVYFFGFGHMPGRQTNSILEVPVVADNPGEPCRGPGDTIGGCDQGWRWYLDRVVDPDGNVQSLIYQREQNWFSAIGGLGGNDSYHRAGLLTEIIYGGRGWDSGSYSARVLFGLQWRCIYLVSQCPAPAAGNTGGFPDVPVDLICTKTSACAVHAPSFFTGRRYAWVRTEVKIGSTWKYVAQHNIVHSFGDGLNGVARKLQVDQLQHAAVAFGKLNAYPTTKFGYLRKDNRADHGGSISKAMRHNRIGTVTNPFGGKVTVTYGQNRPCASTYNPYPRWDQNVRDCFPQSVKDGAHRRTGVFHKYLVTRVVESPGVGSPDLTTDYAYQGDPAWAFDTGAFARDEDETGWSRWRGYGTTTITQGDASTRQRVFRGWDGDPTLVQDAGGDWVPLGHRTVQVETFDGTASYPDHHALAGRTLEEQELGTLDGVAGSVLQSRRHEYERRTTHDPGENFLFDAEWVGLASTTESVATAPGIFLHRRSQTSYSPSLQPISTLEEGWLHESGDERCSITTYADNPALGMFTYPAVNQTVAGGCDSTDLLSRAETYYDGSGTLGAPPSRGNPTRQRTLIEGDRWSETTTTFDELGRPVEVTDPNGGVSTTAYGVTAGAPATQIPIRTTVTNALGHQTVTDWHPEFGVANRMQDPNGNVTDYTYDEFGRLVMVWLPTEPLAFLEPSWRFSYDIPNRAVRARRLVSEARCCEDAVFEDTWVVYDGFWRERQVQGRSPAGAALVSETTYDNRGQLRDETLEQVQPGTPGRYLPGTNGWPNRTRLSYDELGRVVRKEWLRGSAVAHATTTSYGADTVTVTGPEGRAVRERMDGLGRTVAVSEHTGQDWVTSEYRYDLGDRLRSVTDPAGNRIDYSYNLAGWRTGQQDPDRGIASFGYDDAGNQTSVTDALGNQIHTSYDPLSRQVERRAGSPAGQLLASWEYDGAPGGTGQPHRELTHTPEGSWISEVVGYDAKGRPTGSRLVVPAGIPGLSGTYSTTRTYDRADRVRSVTYPAVGGLPQETVTTDYNDAGLATRMAGLAEYVWGVSYDDRGRRVSAGFGPRPGGEPWLAKTWTYDVDQQLNGAETFLAGSAPLDGIVSDHALTFDPAGNLTSKLTRQDGLAWRECFGYDARSRLTSAHTVAAGSSCAGGQPGTGDRAYQQSYSYSPDGRLLAKVQDGVTTGYSYPAPGSPRPHAPSAVDGQAYSWDAAGKLVSRTVAGGGAETFTWDGQGRLAAVAGPGGETRFEYDAAGQRLLRRLPDGRVTLYLAGHEVTASADGSSVSAVREYTFEGQLVATRSPAGVEYVLSDPAGSVELAVSSGGLPSATRAYDPYGRVRAQTGQAATDRGFIGQIEDATTGLSYLNARYYDAAIGVFISADALYDPAKVKSLNPYSYASNNPATFADPSGLYSMYAWGLEVENSQLRSQNNELRSHIRRLGNHIEDLQGIIRKQQKQINKLVTYVRALEAEIARQASIIRRLQARVAYLQRVVVAQQREISRLRWVVARQQQVIRYQAGVIRYQAGVIRYQAGVIRHQAGVIRYQRGVITALVYDAVAPGYRMPVLTSIFNGTGIPVRMRRSFNPETMSNDGPLVPATWNGELEILGSRRVAAERAGAYSAGMLSAAEDRVADLEFESDFHETIRDQHYAELHSTDMWTTVCNANSIGGGAYTLARGSNPYIAGGSAALGIYCVFR